MSDEVALIKERVDIVDLVGQQVALKKAGRAWKGLCPFHDDRNPSFSVNPELGWYQCWSCGKKGDIFTWVMETQHVEFPEALRILAEQAGVELTRQQGAPASERKLWEEMTQAAQDFYRQQFANAKLPQEYCQKRGLTPEVIQAWGLGYGGANDQQLALALKKKGYPLQICENLFLVRQDVAGGYQDRFWGRLTFPIRDEHGKVVAFGGRILGQGEPKYINSSDTPLYRKSRLLYAMDRAKASIRESGTAILCEGYMDVIGCYRAGIHNAVANLGTALTDDQVRILKRFAERVIVLYDADAAGQKAAVRAAHLISEAGLTPRIALMPDGEDPDSLVNQGDAAALLKAIEDAGDPFDFELRLIEREHPVHTDEFWTKAAESFAHIGSPIELERKVQGVARRMPGINDPKAQVMAFKRMIQTARRAIRTRSVPGDRPAAPALNVTRFTRDERIIIMGLGNEATKPESWKAISRPELFRSPVLQSLARTLLETFGSEAPAGKPRDWLGQVKDETAAQTITDLLLSMDAPAHRWVSVAEKISSIESREVADAIRKLESLQERDSLNEIKKDAAPGSDELRRLSEELRRRHGGD